MIVLDTKRVSKKFKENIIIDTKLTNKIKFFLNEGKQRILFNRKFVEEEEKEIEPKCEIGIVGPSPTRIVLQSLYLVTCKFNLNRYQRLYGLWP